MGFCEGPGVGFSPEDFLASFGNKGENNYYIFTPLSGVLIDITFSSVGALSTTVLATFGTLLDD